MASVALVEVSSSISQALIRSIDDAGLCGLVDIIGIQLIVELTK